MNFISSTKATLLLLCFLYYPFAIYADEQKTSVVVTIKPIEALVLAIAKDTVDIQRLLPDYASLHDYHFRPSDIKKLNNADIIFRIDEDMESFLSPLLKTLKQTSIISLADAPNIQLLSLISAEKEPHNAHNQHEHETKNTHHHDSNSDLHVWMSPYNGIAMANKITEALSLQNPQHSGFYTQNLKNLIQEIKRFTDDFLLESKTFKQKPYLVFHDSWQYFAKAFHLNKLSSIALHADIQAGARTIYHTRKLISQSQANCLFSEPNFRPKTMTILTEGFDIKTAEIDSLANHLKVTPQLYLDLLHHTAQQVKKCLL